VTTSQSPAAVLKQQADQIAKHLKAAERGEATILDPSGRLAASCASGKPDVTFAVVMDDKILKVTMAWGAIRESSEEGVSAWIVEHMSGRRNELQ